MVEKIDYEQLYYDSQYKIKLLERRIQELEDDFLLISKNDKKKISLKNEIIKEFSGYCNRTDCSGRIKNSKKYDSVVQQRDLYKSAIDEIKKLIEDNIRWEPYFDSDNGECNPDGLYQCDVEDILQIIDEALGSENNE